MKKKSLLFLITFAALCVLDAKAQTPAGCQSITTYYDYAHKHVHEQYYVFSSNLSVKQGPYKVYSQLGVLLEDGSYNKGVGVGKWTYRDENNALATVESFDQNGIRDGEYISYEDDAKDPTKVLPTIDAFYKHGKKNGEDKEWYTYTDDGFYALREDDTYRNDTLVSATGYHYVHGSKFLTTRKDSAGLILVHYLVYYQDGIKVADFADAYTKFNDVFSVFDWGDLARHLNELPGLMGDLAGGVGTRTDWYDTTGVIMDKVTFSPDRRIAKYKRFNRQGKLEVEGETVLVNGGGYVDNGNYTVYYPSGAKQSEGTYVNGQIIGRLSFWNEDGSKKEMKYYDLNDSIVFDTTFYLGGAVKTLNIYDKNGNTFYYEGYTKTGAPDSILQNLITNRLKDYLPRLNSVAWYQILNKNFLAAIATCHRGLRYDSTNLYLEGNLADAYLLSGNYQSAMDIYKKYMGQNIDANLKWEQAIKNDFANFKSRGIQSDNMDKALKELNLQ